MYVGNKCTLQNCSNDVYLQDCLVQEGVTQNLRNIQKAQFPRILLVGIGLLFLQRRKVERKVAKEETTLQVGQRGNALSN